MHTKKQRKLIKPKEKKALYAHISESIVKDYHSGEQFGDWEKIYDCSFKGLKKSNPNNSYHYQRVEVSDKIYDSKKVGVVIVTYGDGDSFGHSSGEMCVGCISDNQNVIDRFIECFDNEGEYEKLQKEYPEDYFNYWYQWGGYFNRIEEHEVYYINLSEEVEELPRY